MGGAGVRSRLGRWEGSHRPGDKSLGMPTPRRSQLQLGQVGLYLYGFPTFNLYPLERRPPI